MCRGFTVDFDFESLRYQAWVILRQQDYRMSLEVMYLDETSAQFVPDRRFVLDLMDGLKLSSNVVTPGSEQFINTTTDAIADFLQNEPD